MTWAPGPAWLFCPANRPDRYGKALAIADVVIVDLEDAVAVDAKPAAREALRGLVDSPAWRAERTVVRINAVTTRDHGEDLRLVRDLALPRVMLSKAEHPDDVATIACQVIPLVETPRGVEWAGRLAEPDNVIAMMWGADDLAAACGGTQSRKPDGTYRDVARFARSRTLMAAKACGRWALDGVHMDIGDESGLRAECEDAVAVGFDGTVAIHPSQVPVIRGSYTPAPEQVRRAERLLAAVGDQRGVATFEGRMVDGPVLRQAERILQLAAAKATATDPSARGPHE